MKKLTTSVLVVVLSSSFGMLSAQEKGTDTTNIREVVLTGAMGIKKRQDAVTSAQKQVGTQELTQAANPNAAQALVGKVAGLNINTMTSSVNPTLRVNLRGNRTITGSTSPIVIIDGVMSEMVLFQQLPPEIIESVNVIKGQQGSALYGPKGSNGAIVVVTKRGAKSQKIQFSLSNSVDISSVYKLPYRQTKYGQGWYDGQTIEGTDFVPYENGSWGPSYGGVMGGTTQIQGLPQPTGGFLTAKYAPIEDNIGLFFKNGIMYQNGLTMNIGGSDSYAILSLNRVQNDFMVENDVMKRNSVNFKAGKKLGNFSIDGSFNFSDQNINQTNGNIWYNLIQLPTNVDVRRYANSGIAGNYSPYVLNPYWMRDNIRSKSNSTIFNGTIGMNYKFNDNINLVYNGNMLTQGTQGMSYMNQYKKADTYTYFGTGDPSWDGSTIFEHGRTELVSTFNQTTSKYFRYYHDLMVNFDYDLSDNFNLKFTLGNSISDAKSENAEVGGTNLDIPGWYHINNVLSPTNQSSLNNNTSRSRTFALFGNADLSYKDYLFLNATLRWDKLSTLSSTPYETAVFSNKGILYPSVGLSFIPTKAIAGLKGKVLNYAKISGSYTVTGNDGSIGAYTLDQIGAIPTGFPFGNLSSYYIRKTAVNPNIVPEYNYTTEGNLQLGFLNDRITIDASAYQTKTEDLITYRSVSSTTGITSMLDNVGKMTNKGFEVELGVTPFKSKDFEWNLKGSYSKYRSIVNELAEGANEVALYSDANWPVGIFAVKGSDMPVIKGTAYTRDPNGNIVVDADGLPIIDSQYKVLGKVNPDYVLNFSTQIRYKNLTLSAVADYRTGNSFFASSMPTMGFVGTLEKSANFDRSQGYVIPGSVQYNGSAYVPNNTPVISADYSGVTDYFSGVYDSVAEEFVIDGSAFKIREIALSYKLPKDLIENTFVNSVTFGVYARNPFAWYAKENRNFADPESSTYSLGGIAGISQFPTSRSFGFNLNVSF